MTWPLCVSLTPVSTHHHPTILALRDSTTCPLLKHAKLIHTSGPLHCLFFCL